MSIRCLLLMLLSLGLATGCAEERSLVDESQAPAEETLKPPEGSIQEPTPIELPKVEVSELLEKLSVVFRDARGFEVRGKLQQVALASNGHFSQGLQSPLIERVFRVEKPNRLRLSAVLEGGPIIVSDGNELVSFVPRSPTDLPYSRQPAPPQVLDMLHNPEVSSLDIPMRLLPMHFAVDDIRQVLFGPTTETQLLGAEQVDGQPAYHLLVKEQKAGFDWHLWLAAEGPPLPLLARFDMGPQKLVVGTVERELNVAVFDQYSDWKIDPPEDPAVFTFQPPPGSREISSLYEDPSPLLGQPAPPFSFKTLSGDTVTLESHAGKDVVVLDFWATWCDPCHEQGKLLAEIAPEYTGRGVQFYNVNSGDSAAVIQRFIDEKKLQLNVLLDPRKSGIASYQASDLPLMVVIDRAGTIHSVNSGFRPVLAWVLRKQLDRALKDAPPAEASASPDSAATSATPPPPPTAEAATDSPSGQP